MKVIKCKEIIEGKDVDISGSGQSSLVNYVQGCGGKHISFFYKKSIDLNLGKDVRISSNELEVANTTSDVCLLDGKAIILLAARFPKSPEYSLIRIRFNIYWIPAFAGLVRRLFKRYLKIEGFTVLGENKRSLWLVLKKATPPLYKQMDLFIPTNEIQAFLNWAKENNIRYCVPRFWDNLPAISRKDGDLDIILSDLDKDRIVHFLQDIASRSKNKVVLDSAKMDIALVYGRDFPGEIPYYPPALSEQMIRNAIDGPANSLIPEPKDAFLSFIYHCLYHTTCGYKAGIKSNLPNARVEKSPRDDYSGIITKMANDLGVNVSVDMESLDEYLAQEGWRPPLDTLAIIASHNLWVQHRFFDSKEKREDVGLGVMVFRRRAVAKNNFIDKILKIIDKSKFSVIAVKEFSEEEQRIMAKKLRGGNWGDDFAEKDDSLPAAAVVVLDKKPSPQRNYEIRFVKPNRVRKLKLKLRRNFDTGGESVVHATDTTLEAEEYIEIAFNEEKEEIKKKIEEELNKRKR